MSFSPLPDSLEKRAAHWAALPFCRLVDLGCGGGEVGCWLRPHGLKVLGLDRSLLERGSHLHLRADALDPPLRKRSLDGLLAANLLHHLLTQDRSSSFLERWLGLLKPGGWLFLLGDEPSAGMGPAENNYQQLQAWLAEIMPRERGPLVPGEEIAARLEKAGARHIHYGHTPNHHEVDADAVLSLLAGSGTVEAGGQAARLMERIRRDGLALGRYWWVEAQAPDETPRKDDAPIC